MGLISPLDLRSRARPIAYSALSHDEWVYARLRLVAQIEREHGATASRIQLSQSHLASMVGVSRQTLNAALGRLQKRGLLRVGFRLIELVD